MSCFTEAKYTLPAYHMALRWDVISILDFLIISIKSYGKYREKEVNTVLRYCLCFTQRNVSEILLRAFSLTLFLVLEPVAYTKKDITSASLGRP